MNMPLVTILTPCFNHQKYLDDYFQSIINQTYNNLELILIDDCSTDQSRIIINNWMEKLENRFLNIVFIPREENRGLIYNLNEGIKLASGKYVSIFASDDIMHKANIEEKVSFLEQNCEYPMVYSDGFLIGENTTYIEVQQEQSEFKKFSDNQPLKEGDIFQDLIDLGCFIPAPSVVIKKDILLKVDGYNSKYIFEDYQMWLEISRTNKIGLVRSPLVYYRLSENSLSRSVDTFFRIVKDQEELLYSIKKENNDIDISRGLELLYMHATKVFFRTRSRNNFFRYYKKLKGKSIGFKLRRIVISTPLIYKLVLLIWNKKNR